MGRGSDAERKVDIKVDRTAPVTLHLQIRNAIRAKIQSGAWPSDFQLPTYKEFAKLTGVSLITVQQAIGFLVKEGLLVRKRGQGVFVTGPGHRRSENLIGLLLPDVRHQFFSGLAHVIQSYANRAGFAVAMFSLETDPSGAVHAVDLALQQNVAGIITSPTIQEFFRLQFARVIERNIPLVFVDGKSSDEGFDYVETDNRKGIGLVLDHLIELGHERIGFACCQILTQGVRERMRAFQELLEERRLRFDPPLLQVSYLPDDQGGENAGCTLLSLREPPTAIVGSNDLAAVGVMRAARKMGFECPRDLSIVGFDDLELSSHLEVPLTTIRQPVDEIGQCAVTLLMRRILERREEERSSTILAPELVVRSSTARASVRKAEARVVAGSSRL